MPFFSRFHTRRRGGYSPIGEHPASKPPRRPPLPPHLEAKTPPTPQLNGTFLSQRYAHLAQNLRSSLPSTCRWLGPGDVELVSGHPIAAGGSANIYEATHDGRKVVLKSYHYCVTSDVAQAVARFLNEVHLSSLLHNIDINVVSLMGVYSTETHPFGLVYEYADGLDLRQYLRSEPDAERLKLLTIIAQDLSRMHDLGIVHGNLQTPNILVDNTGTPRIAGLGNTSALPNSTTRTRAGREGNASADRLSRSLAPELVWPGVSTNLTDPLHTHPTKASDIYAFGVMAWEVLTGHPPFFNMTEITATYSMLNGDRPPRPNLNHDISDRVWRMIEQCWHGVPSKRLSAGEAVKLLETELSDHRTLPRAQ